MKKLFSLVLLTASFGLVPSIALSAAVDGTLKWVGDPKGGNWMDANNWAVDGTSSYSVSQLLTMRTEWNLNGLADQAVVDAGSSEVIIGGITWTTANSGRVTLTGSANHKFSGEDGVTVNVSAGNWLEWKMNHYLWAGDTWGKVLVFAGDGTIHLNPSSWYECYCQDFQPCVNTTVIIGPKVSMNLSTVTLWNNSTLKFEGDCYIANLKLGGQTVTVDTQGHTLTITAGESSVNDAPVDGRIVGGGQLVYAGGVRRLFGASSDLTGYAGSLVLYDGKIDINASAKMPSSGLPVVMNGGGALALHENTTVKNLSGVGANGSILIDGGKTVTVTGDAGTASSFASAFSGEGSVVKKGADYSLTLSGSNAMKGGLTVAEGEVVLKRPRAREGLVRRWSFEDPNDLCHDSSGYDGHFVSTKSIAPAQMDGVGGGKALYMGGTAEERCKLEMTYTDADGRKDFPLNWDERSVSMWLKPEYRAEAWSQIYREGDWGKDGGQFTIWTIEGGKKLMLLIDNWITEDTDNSPVIDVPDLFDGQWHHVVASYKFNEASGTGRLRLWYDGALKAEKTGAHKLWLWNPPVVLGFGSGDSRYTGGVDELAVWNRELTKEDVAAEYALKDGANTSLKDAPPTPICHWAFNDPSNPGKDEMGVADLEKNPAASQAPSLVDVSGTVSGKATDSSLYLPAAKMPANFPHGKFPCSFSIRLANQGWWDGDRTVFEWGGRDTRRHRFRLLCGGCPRTLKICPPIWTDSPAFTTVLAHSQSYSSASSTRFSHIVATHDPLTGVFRIYRDGREEYMNSDCWGDELGVSEGDLYLNGEPGIDGATGSWVDDVQVFDRVLTPAEVAALSRSLVSPTGKAGQVLSPESPVTVAAGAKLTVDGEGLRAKSITGAGDVVVAPGAGFAASSWEGFTGKVSGVGKVLLSSDTGKGPTEATVSADVALEDNVLALDYKTASEPLVKTTGIVRFPNKFTLKLVNPGVSAAKWAGRRFVIAECGGYVGPATTAGLTFVPNSDDPKADIRGKFIYEKGVLVLQMSGGGFTITIR